MRKWNTIYVDAYDKLSSVLNECRKKNRLSYSKDISWKDDCIKFIVPLGHGFVVVYESTDDLY